MKGASAPPEKVRRDTHVAPERLRAVIIRVDREGLRTLRQLALDKDRTLQSLGIEALNDLLRKYGCKQLLRRVPRWREAGLKHD